MANPVLAEIKYLYDLYNRMYNRNCLYSTSSVPKRDIKKSQDYIEEWQNYMMFVR